MWAQWGRGHGWHGLSDSAGDLSSTGVKHWAHRMETLCASIWDLAPCRKWTMIERLSIFWEKSRSWYCGCEKWFILGECWSGLPAKRIMSPNEDRVIIMVIKHLPAYHHRSFKSKVAGYGMSAIHKGCAVITRGQEFTCTSYHIRCYLWRSRDEGRLLCLPCRARAVLHSSLWWGHVGLLSWWPGSLGMSYTEMPSDLSYKASKDMTCRVSGECMLGQTLPGNRKLGICSTSHLKETDGSITTSLDMMGLIRTIWVWCISGSKHGKEEGKAKTNTFRLHYNEGKDGSRMWIQFGPEAWQIMMANVSEGIAPWRRRKSSLQLLRRHFEGM